SVVPDVPLRAASASLISVGKPVFGSYAQVDTAPFASSRRMTLWSVSQPSLVVSFLALVVWNGRPKPSIWYAVLWLSASVTTVLMLLPWGPSGSVYANWVGKASRAGRVSWRPGHVGA